MATHYAACNPTSWDQSSEASTGSLPPDARIKRIAKLQFGITNPDEIRCRSVTQAICVNGKHVPAGLTRYEVCMMCKYILRMDTEVVLL